MPRNSGVKKKKKKKRVPSPNSASLDSCLQRSAGILGVLKTLKSCNEQCFPNLLNQGTQQNPRNTWGHHPPECRMETILHCPPRLLKACYLISLSHPLLSWTWSDPGAAAQVCLARFSKPLHKPGPGPFHLRGCAALPSHLIKNPDPSSPVQQAQGGSSNGRSQPLQRKQRGSLPDTQSTQGARGVLRPRCSSQDGPGAAATLSANMSK